MSTAHVIGLICLAFMLGVYVGLCIVEAIDKYLDRREERE